MNVNTDMRQGFWDKTPLPSPSTLFTPEISPESPSPLRSLSHYSNLPDSILTLIAKDLEIEQSILETYIEKGRLEEWWKGVVDAARSSVRQEKDRQGEDMKERRRREKEVKGKWRRRDEEVYGGGGDVERDGEGDVVMGD